MFSLKKTSKQGHLPGPRGWEGNHARGNRSPSRQERRREGTAVETQNGSPQPRCPAGGSPSLTYGRPLAGPLQEYRHRGKIMPLTKGDKNQGGRNSNQTIRRFITLRVQLLRSAPSLTLATDTLFKKTHTTTTTTTLDLEKRHT